MNRIQLTCIFLGLVAMMILSSYPPVVRPIDRYGDGHSFVSDGPIRLETIWVYRGHEWVLYKSDRYTGVTEIDWIRFVVASICIVSATGASMLLVRGLVYLNADGEKK